MKGRPRGRKVINCDLAGILTRYSLQCAIVENPEDLKRQIEKLKEDLKNIEKQIEDEENG